MTTLVGSGERLGVAVAAAVGGILLAYVTAWFIEGFIRRGSV